MSDDATPRLGLPYLAAAQAQKHVTVNEALAQLDALVQPAVRSRTVAVQPTAPADGDLYLLPQGASGSAWSLLPAGAVARFEAGAWTSLAPQPGALVLVEDEAIVLVRDASAWRPVGDFVGELGALDRLGVGTSADAAHPLTARLNGALLTAQRAAQGGSGDLRLTLETAATAGVASVLWQTGYSGRAELGLVGDDGLTLKLSADGASWTPVLRAAPGGAMRLSPPGGVICETGPSPYGMGVTILPSTDAVSRRAGLQVGLWQVGQDAYGSGSPDLYIYNGPGNVIQMALPQGGGMVLHDHTVFTAKAVALAASYAFAALPDPAAHPGGRVWCPDLPGGAGPLVCDGARWRREGGGVQVVSADADFTLAALASAPVQVVTAAFSADRTATLSTTGAWQGAALRVVRPAGGTRVLHVGGLCDVASGGWCDVAFDGSAWRLTGRGAL